MKEKKCKKCGRKIPVDYPSKCCEACNNKKADSAKGAVRVIVPMLGMAILGVFAPGLANKINLRK